MTQPPAAPSSRPRGRISAFKSINKTTVIGACTFLLCIGAVVAPSAYVVEGPGPAVNTLGEDPTSGDNVIQVSGTKTYPTESELSLTTVSVAGGPGRSISGTQALWAWIDGSEDLKPREYVYPAGTTSQQQDQENALAMTNSQHTATAAALTELDIDFSTRPVVAGFAADLNKDVLKPKDVITSVAGTKVTGYEQVPDAVKASTGKSIGLTVERGGKKVEVSAEVGTAETEDGTRQRSLGIFITPDYDFPFKVDFGLQDIGGPSAGTMMALGLIDKLTEGSLAGDAKVAGTGTVTDNGEIGAIGGIPQKVVGARKAGATVFLAPEANCAELNGRVPDGITVYSVSTVHDAREILEKLSGKGGPSLVGDQRCG
ncbi:MAG: YlbL family protein [Galactobacter sp.]|uniref:YlbL family protein n=1 Tax=Galactobacter sp. TaxID=2676125 RepID=UPI0025C54985|nr:S16 family serine protease [Galactobacter sp.]